MVGYFTTPASPRVVYLTTLARPRVAFLTTPASSRVEYFTSPVARGSNICVCLICSCAYEQERFSLMTIVTTCTWERVKRIARNNSEADAS